jgi:hypothetical protein
MRALRRLIDNTGGVVTFNNNNLNDPAVGFAIATVLPRTLKIVRLIRTGMFGTAAETCAACWPAG